MDHLRGSSYVSPLDTIQNAENFCYQFNGRSCVKFFASKMSYCHMYYNTLNHNSFTLLSLLSTWHTSSWFKSTCYCWNTVLVIACEGLGCRSNCIEDLPLCHSVKSCCFSGKRRSSLRCNNVPQNVFSLPNAILSECKKVCFHYSIIMIWCSTIFSTSFSSKFLLDTNAINHWIWFLNALLWLME